ncbi:MAG TPA: hypothetical protein VMB47_14820 [Candidatus Aquilonibacter sp.]|nr:hypothetical protein [Candidatus Aquilonibacter sp.]
MEDAPDLSVGFYYCFRQFGRDIVTVGVNEGEVRLLLVNGEIYDPYPPDFVSCQFGLGIED